MSIEQLNIHLSENQSASPRRCGSCHFFDRQGRADWVGRCTISLPPWVMARSRGDGGDDRSLADTCSCDLYQPKASGPHAGDTPLAKFVQVKTWHAGSAFK